MINTRYEKVAESEPDDFDGSASSTSTSSTDIRNPSSKSTNWTPLLTAINILVFITSTTLFTLTYLHQSLPTDTPLASLLPLKYQSKQVEGTLYNEASLSQQELLLRTYPPNKETDAAWEALSKIEIIPVREEVVTRLGKDPEIAVKIPEEFGFGDQTHIIQLDAQHNLHCLDAVRKYALREHYFPPTTTSTTANKNDNGMSPLSEAHLAHLTHCLSILRQELTCNPSPYLITHNWLRTQTHPFPDFAIKKECVNHEELLSWQAKNGISEEQWEGLQLANQGPEEKGKVLEPPPKLLEWILRNSNSKKEQEAGELEDHHLR